MHHHHHPPHHRRRKKRPNYGTRTVEVCRGSNGFGFTISGQQPCILSCIVANSPADLAGLRAGNFLISVNGLNVSKLPHESVVQLIGNSPGNIKMTIAENYYSDSSDDDNIVHHNYHRARPKYLHHGKLANNKTHKKIEEETIDSIPSRAHNVIVSPKASNSKDISNVSAMVRVNEECLDDEPSSSSPSLEYRAVVGYLGTIEMPKQIATSSKLQTVRSCIRKMRQEKRNPSTVLMTILPSCLTLKNNNSAVIAKYPSSRINYVSSSSENNDNKFFGLVTSQIYADGQIYDESMDIITNGHDINISNSCHVFVIDTKLCDHPNHIDRADIFKIICTKDPISNLCLEFPNNAEYVVNLIRSMYTLKSIVKVDLNVHHRASKPPHLRNLNRFNPRAIDENLHDLLANSPQPSEITTTSSNSDSGIGFHNDLSNISDRIVVVDFPRHKKLMFPHPMVGQHHLPPRPVGITNDSPFSLEPNKNIRSKVSSSSRLTVRAMPDPVVSPNPNSPNYNERAVDVPNDFCPEFISHNNHMQTARSCDDIMISYEQQSTLKLSNKKMSMDDMATLKPDSREHIFLLPARPVKKCKKVAKKISSCDDSAIGLSTHDATNTSKLLSYKLSPKVFGVARPLSISVENLVNPAREREKRVPTNLMDYGMIWGSLLEIRMIDETLKPVQNVMEGTYSEPDLRDDCESRNLNPGTSPFRRWGQSSMRTRTADDIRGSLSRRPSSLTASENDVYTKSEKDDQTDSDNGGVGGAGGKCGPSTWSTSFEKLLNDSAGIHTFSEFLRKEFSAENIYFWAACERYSKIAEQSNRIKEAQAIFEKHMAVGASEAVNVDSQARTTTQENLQIADRNLFQHAQKQIFNLMKFDSYARFIRSDLYKDCVQAEVTNSKLPYPGGEQMDSLLKTKIITPTATPTKLKKSLSNADDRRRKSLLPWHRKTRCKSKDRVDDARSVKSSESAVTTTTTTATNAGGLKVVNSVSDIHSSRSSLSSFDAAISSRSNVDSEDGRNNLCRFLLSGGATTIVETKNCETIRMLVERLLEKRGICYQAYEAFLTGINTPIDLDAPSSNLAGNEIQIEQRVIFKLDLPNRKVISVKSKPCKVLGEVLRPILNKYNYKLDLVQVYFRENSEPLDMALPVTVTDGQRLQIICRPIVSQNEIAQISTTLNSGNSIQKVQRLMVKNGNNADVIGPPVFNAPMAPPLTMCKPPVNLCNKTTQTPAQHSNTLDEITNKVFNELMQGKVESQLIPVPKNSDQASTKSDDWGSETSSGIFGRLRLVRDQNFRFHKLKKSTGIQCKSSTTGSEDGGINEAATNNTPLSSSTTQNIKKPLATKINNNPLGPGAPNKLQVAVKSDNHDFLEGLKRAQRSRLEDQRGTEINFELPDFLKDKENSLKNKYRHSPASGGEPIIFARAISEELTPTTSPPPVPSSNLSVSVRPQPAPRLSINSLRNNVNSNATNNNISDTGSSPIAFIQQKTDNISSSSTSSTSFNSSSTDHHHMNAMDASFSSMSGSGGTLGGSGHSNYEFADGGGGDDDDDDASNQRGPPPLPPKPKILPIKPSNWGQANSGMSGSNVAPLLPPLPTTTEPFKIPKEWPRRLAGNNNSNSNNNNNIHENDDIKTPRNVYLDQPSSSFV